MIRSVLQAAAMAFALLLAVPAHADTTTEMPESRPGWAIHHSDKSYEEMIDAVKAAAASNGMGIVTEAGPTDAARARGVEIPGNRVIGIFNNVYAVRILGMSTEAMIEAPIRVYVTQSPDGGSVLSYKTPSLVFEPYLDKGGSALATAAEELDAIFADIAAAALG